MVDVAIVGAGPYGLSLAAHFRRQGIKFRIFGRPMDSWLSHMPKGMMLKSDGFASNLYDPEGAFTLKQFCSERGIEYGDTGVPVRLETFNAYGLAFQERMVPELEESWVRGVGRTPDGFLLTLETGETVKARRVVLAVGITHFEHIPPVLQELPAEKLSHSARHQELEPFRGRRVVVVGGGASALDTAALLGEAGAEVQLVTRRPELRFHTKPNGKPRSRWQQIRHPHSGLGPGMRSRFFADAPLAFHYLPEALRLKAVRKALGPSGGWFIRDKIIGRVRLHLGCTPVSVRTNGDGIHLRLQADGKGESEVTTDHIIAATGYKPRLSRLTLLTEEIRTRVEAVAETPVLSSGFESSVPGLYFVGVAAANSFGPVMRFAFGAGFAAERVTRTIVRSLARERASAPAARLVPDPE